MTEEHGGVGPSYFIQIRKAANLKLKKSRMHDFRIGVLSGFPAVYSFGHLAASFELAKELTSVTFPSLSKLLLMCIVTSDSDITDKRAVIPIFNIIIKTFSVS